MLAGTMPAPILVVTMTVASMLAVTMSVTLDLDGIMRLC